MTDNQRLWLESREGLRRAVTALGYPAGLADLLARELGSPRGMDRLASCIRQTKPRTTQALVDEMLAIKGQIEAWREKKENEAPFCPRLFGAFDEEE